MCFVILYEIQAQNMILGKSDDLPIQRNLQTKDFAFDFFIIRAVSHVPAVQFIYTTCLLCMNITQIATYSKII